MTRLRDATVAAAAALAAATLGGCGHCSVLQGAFPAPRACAPPAVAPGPSPATSPRPVGPASRPAPAHASPGVVLDHRTGRTVTFDEMARALAGVRVVYVGESHDQRDHHRFQERVLRAAALQSGGPLALGLEMFSRPQQPALDAFSRGEIDEEGLRERSDWAKRWGFGWEMYRPLLSFARERGIALVALNAPRETTRKVARGGLESLTPEERAAVPPLDLGNDAHRRFVRAAFGQHGATMEAAKFERFYTAQVVWDETMADTAARWLAASGPGSRMVVVAGNGHVQGRHAIPERAARRGARPYVSIVQEVVAPGTVEALRADPSVADFTAFSAPSGPPEPDAPPKPTAPPKAP